MHIYIFKKNISYVFLYFIRENMKNVKEQIQKKKKINK